MLTRSQMWLKEKSAARVWRTNPHLVYLLKYCVSLQKGLVVFPGKFYNFLGKWRAVVKKLNWGAVYFMVLEALMKKKMHSDLMFNVFYNIAHQHLRRSKVAFFLTCRCLRWWTGNQAKLALIDSWSRGKASGGYLSSHFVAWTLYLHAITNPTLHKVFIHPCCSSPRCTCTTPLPYFKPLLQNRQPQRQLAFWLSTCFPWEYTTISSL